MQNFAINGGLLNGDPEVWIDSTSASVVIHSAGGVMLGRSLIGSFSVAVSTSLALAYMAKLSGKAGVTLAASGALTNGISLVGVAPVKVSLAGDLLRWVMIEGVTPTVIDLRGDIAVVPSISATFAVVMRSALDLHVAAGRAIAGYMPVVVASTLQAYRVPGTQLSGLAGVQLAGIGRANLKIASPPGSVAITVKAAGSYRLGDKLHLEGFATIDTHVRGSLESWHYVYSEGSAAIAISARAERHGNPNIPGYYVEAPETRALRVIEENRRFIVPAERRV